MLNWGDLVLVAILGTAAAVIGLALTVEYGLVIALVAIVAIAGLIILGDSINSLFADVAASI